MRRFHPSARSPRFFGRIFRAVAGVGLITVAAHAQDNPLEVDVRPTVVDKSAMWAHTTKARGEGGHGKIYGIYSVQLVQSDQRLVKPVDDSAILQLLSEELNKNGFQLFAPGHKPEILLTVSYGRGEVQNPYFHEQGEVGGFGAPPPPAMGSLGGGAGAPSFSDATSVTLTGATAIGRSVFDSKTPGYEAKLQKAGFEKLFIRVTAWAYPTDPKAKLKMLWKTVIVVDDPDHRDLNVVAQKMLEAAAPFFDKEIKDPEATVFKPLPDGHVNVGAPEVLGLAIRPTK